jgi:uncharacterized protein (TIGR03435 family)
MLRKTTMDVSKRFMKIACGGMLLAAGVAWAQAPPAPKLEFEVASVKAAQPIQAQVASGKIHVGMKVDGARVDIGSMSLSDLIPMAFKVKQYQVSGPAWISADMLSAQRFDIMAKMPEGATSEQVPEMLQALLADRFKLTFHRENREHAMYALVVAKGGPKLKESMPEPEVPAGGDNSKDDGKKGISIPTGDGSQARITQDGKGGMVVQGGPGSTGGTMRIMPGPDGVHMEASKMTMAGLAEALTRFVDRPVLDMTELKGDYQIALDLSMADVFKAARATGAVPPGALPGVPAGASSPADTASDPSASSVFATVQKLGLKLDPRKEPIETIVIDRLEKAPTEN